MNISNHSAFHHCTSCGVCAAICAKSAITIRIDKEGFYRPIVDLSLCNDCGLCTSVCYKYDRDVLMTSNEGLNEKPLYSAWSNNDEVVKQTTSGGIGDLLARQLRKDGYQVVGVVYNEIKTRAEHRIALSEEDLYGFRGSKYIQSYTFDAFKEIVKNYRDEKYAVFGTPCQIYALNRFATKRKVRDNFIFVDLYCHGCPSLHAWTKYQADIKKKLGVDRFDSVSFRSKMKGWGGYITNFYAEGKSVYVGKKANDKFYEMFFSNQVLNEACYDCKLRSTLEYTDIRLGDFWGHKYLHNQRGVSAISLATTKGKDVFSRIESSIVCLTCSYDELLPYQNWHRSYRMDSENRKAILATLADSHLGIDDAVKELRKRQGVKKTFIRHIKTALAVFPLGLTNSIKRILYKIR